MAARWYVFPFTPVSYSSRQLSIATTTDCEIMNQLIIGTFHSSRLHPEISINSRYAQRQTVLTREADIRHWLTATAPAWTNDACAGFETHCHWCVTKCRWSLEATKTVILARRTSLSRIWAHVIGVSWLQMYISQLWGRILERCHHGAERVALCFRVICQRMWQSRPSGLEPRRERRAPRWISAGRSDEIQSG